MTAPARFQATVLGEWPVLATRGPLGKGRPPPPHPCGPHHLHSNLLPPTSNSGDMRQPGHPPLSSARPAPRAAQLPQPCRGLSSGSSGYPPNQGISGEAGTLETTGSDAWGTKHEWGRGDEI